MSDLTDGLRWRLYQDPHNMAALIRIAEEITAGQPTVEPTLTAGSPEH
jgi:hypothetical protein